MKKKIALLLLAGVLCMSFIACDTDDINGAVNSIEEEYNLDLNVEVKQEDLDKAKEAFDKTKDAVDDAANKVKDVVTDEGVRDAAKDLIDSIKNAGN